MEKIILDTNFLLAVGQFRIDIFSELERICDFNYQICTLDKVVEELKKLAKGNSKDARSARLALALLKKIKIIKTKPGRTDDIIAELSGDYIIATQDKELRKRCKNKLIGIRQKKYLYFAK